MLKILHGRMLLLIAVPLTFTLAGCVAEVDTGGPDWGGPVYLDGGYYYGHDHDHDHDHGHDDHGGAFHDDHGGHDIHAAADRGHASLGGGEHGGGDHGGGGHR